MSRCPICTRESLFAFSSAFTDVMKCQSPFCGHLFAKAAPLGSGQQWVEDADSLLEDFSERDSRLVARLLADGCLSKSGRILDFGSGTGHFAFAIKELLPDADLVCLEAHSPSASRLRSSGLAVWESESEIEGMFDAVTMIEVIEHLDNPVATLKILRRHLRYTGMFFVTTPCGETAIGSRNTNAYDTKEHVHFFTEQSLDLAFRLAGFGGCSYRVINEMYPRRSVLKDLLRPVRAKLLGHHHLVGYVKP